MGAKGGAEFEAQFKRFLEVSLWDTEKNAIASRYQLTTQCQKFCYYNQNRDVLDKAVDAMNDVLNEVSVSGRQLRKRLGSHFPKLQSAVDAAANYISNYL